METRNRLDDADSRGALKAEMVGIGLEYMEMSLNSRVAIVPQSLIDNAGSDRGEPPQLAVHTFANISGSHSATRLLRPHVESYILLLLQARSGGLRHVCAKLNRWRVIPSTVSVGMAPTIHPNFQQLHSYGNVQCKPAGDTATEPPQRQDVIIAVALACSAASLVIAVAEVWCLCRRCRKRKLHTAPPATPKADDLTSHISPLYDMGCEVAEGGKGGEEAEAEAGNNAGSLHLQGSHTQGGASSSQAAILACGPDPAAAASGKQSGDGRNGISTKALGGHSIRGIRSLAELVGEAADS